MGQTIGVLATRQVAVGVVEDNALTGPIRKESKIPTHSGP